MTSTDMPLCGNFCGQPVVKVTTGSDFGDETVTWAHFGTASPFCGPTRLAKPPADSTAGAAQPDSPRDTWTATVTLTVPAGAFDTATFERYLHSQLRVGVVQTVHVASGSATDGPA